MREYCSVSGNESKTNVELVASGRNMDICPFMTARYEGKKTLY